MIIKHQDIIISSTYFTNKIELNLSTDTVMATIFIPSNEICNKMIERGFDFKPLIIEAYKFHVTSSEFEKTQNLFNKKVKTGTTTIKAGSTRVE